MWGRRPGRPGECHPVQSDTAQSDPAQSDPAQSEPGPWQLGRPDWAQSDWKGIVMEIIVRGRHITVPSRFRQHAAAKLAKLEKLDQKAVRIDVEVSKERNPRQSDRRERVELTIRSRGPAIRAEAAADDRYTALDLAFAKLESRLRRASDRRKGRRTTETVRSPEVLAAVAAAEPIMAAEAVRAPATVRAAERA